MKASLAYKPSGDSPVCQTEKDVMEKKVEMWVDYKSLL